MPAPDPWRQPEFFRGVTARRVAAYVVDVVLIMVTAGILWSFLLVLGFLTLGLAWGLLALPGVLVPLLYHTLLVAGPRSATLGMRLMGLRVVTVGPLAEEGGGRPALFQAIILTVTFYVSVAATGALILVVALFNPRRRALHDWVAGTMVVNDLPWEPAGPVMLEGHRER